VRPPRQILPRERGCIACGVALDEVELPMNFIPPTAVPIASMAASEDSAFERHFVMAAPSPAHVRSITSEQLFADDPEVQVAHGDAVYRLRQTSLGKLILTKGRRCPERRAESATTLRAPLPPHRTGGDGVCSRPFPFPSHHEVHTPWPPQHPPRLPHS
jgi:hemin uptake protein HemP